MDLSVNATAAASQQAANTQGAVQLQVLRKVLDMESQQGADLARMVQQAAGVGQSVDYRA